MDSLKIQDAFEPYYAGRKRGAAPRDKRLSAKTEHSLAKEQAVSALPTNVRLSDNKPDSTTEH
ncbi:MULTISPECIES: hypothetical protein [unclassified Mesorhizobium]|uniref:hypothetical protein n=1 Tax=unclassified Mesorhizobium TaxID=325217 RepID=UPI000FCAB02B|nr:MULTISPECIES: hypothetical protein [unclassified Mesorhizobium]RUU62513.1 hypothetical protein EOC99_17780 [Mesorhizobium sp. M7A.T.Ca.TU.009.01.1.1]RUU78544.1 hypothetical protein EOD03_20670 [Mesorhizobium sp. M7A.T.Ca.TU.009.01.1.2]RUT88781.1 hypothetical protein EOD14_05495 [Mesorhizobium sp. M7A.T.Ca.US.000.02.1.1]RUT94294.1 hypothetical protein EOD15_02535 [Mesorhizobium sp. M7A.T.Ca.US.000.02.2.1]RUU05418.1 hypothetical protein EOD12_03400 [Mesorhizobium sp. M7A.T.Ca.TU.009.02.1.1]